MKKGIVLFFLTFFLMTLPAWGEEKKPRLIYVDDPLLAPYVYEIEPEAEEASAEKAHIIFYNGLEGKDQLKEGYDYTMGIINILKNENGTMNPYASYSFTHLAAVVRNFCDVLSLHYPARAGKYEKQARKIIKRLQTAKSQSKIEIRAVLAAGGLFDYLLEDLEVKKIAIDRYFIYKEKSLGIKTPAQILCGFPPEGKWRDTLKYRGYTLVFIDCHDFQRVEDLLIYVVKEVKHGKYSGS